MKAGLVFQVFIFFVCEKPLIAYNTTTPVKRPRFKSSLMEFVVHGIRFQFNINQLMKQSIPKCVVELFS